MTRKERLEAAFDLREVDYTPALGGWIACPDNIAAAADVTVDEYWEDPMAVSIRAYDALGLDGLIGVFVPKSPKDYRCVDHDTYAHAQTQETLEEAVAAIDAMPEADAIIDGFDIETVYADFRQSMLDHQEMCKDMLWMPAQWGAGAQISWYGRFGYENFFLIVGLYEKHARKLMEVGGANGRNMSRVIARAVEDGIYPKAVLLGEDICTQRGPMISTDFIEKYYAPQLKYGLAPLLEVGCRPVWHSDGDVRPMLDMLFDSGVAGLQGFQPECGMVLEELVERRTSEGEPLLIFGPLAVTTELPVMTPDEVTAKVHESIEICKGKASLVIFTGNTINPDVSLENIRAMYEARK